MPTNKPMTKLIGQRIKILRVFNNCPQKEISALLGISQSKVSKIEDGLLELSYSEAWKLASRFCITMEDLADPHPVTISNKKHVKKLKKLKDTGLIKILS